MESTAEVTGLLTGLELNCLSSSAVKYPEFAAESPTHTVAVLLCASCDKQNDENECLARHMYSMLRDFIDISQTDFL